jgi:PadR family transcriptional regulator, regulatory protein PadR
MFVAFASCAGAQHLISLDDIPDSRIKSVVVEFTSTIREAKKGTAELVVLAFLEDESCHGYELTQLIEARSGGALTFNFASLYATLYKLEERKWIQGRWVEKPGQRRRRYYTITAHGRDVLAAQRKEWRRFFELIRDLAGVTYA